MRDAKPRVIDLFPSQASIECPPHHLPMRWILSMYGLQLGSPLRGQPAGGIIELSLQVWGEEAPVRFKVNDTSDRRYRDMEVVSNSVTWGYFTISEVPIPVRNSLKAGWRFGHPHPHPPTPICSTTFQHAGQ